MAAYRVERDHKRARLQTVGTAVETQLRLDRLESGIEMEFRVVALNAAGAGAGSNNVSVVL